MGFISFARVQEKSFSRGILVCIVLLYKPALVLTCFGREHFWRFLKFWFYFQVFSFSSIVSDIPKGNEIH